MTIANWITIIISAVTLSVTLFLAFKQGHFKKIKLDFSPAKIINPIGDGLIDFKTRKVRIPVIAILRLFTYHKKGYKYFCSHIYLTFENRNKYEIEDVTILLTYPRRYFDEHDKHFLKPESSDQEDEKNSYTLVNDTTVQMKYKVKSLHPFSIRQIMHPMIQPIDDFKSVVDVNDPYVASVSLRNFSYYKVDVTISAKNLSKPVYTNFWMVNIINQSYTDFMRNEKVFIYDLTKNYTYPKHVLEIQKIKEYVIGKYRKEALVVKSEHPDISYSHFDPIKEPYNRNWNFEQKN